MKRSLKWDVLQLANRRFGLGLTEEAVRASGIISGN
jgi:hypothetical protein